MRGLESDVMGFTLERITSVLTVRLNQAEDCERLRFSELERSQMSLASSRHAAQAGLMSYLNLATNASLLAVLAAGGRLLGQGKLSTGQLSRFAMQSAFVGLGFAGLSTFRADMMRALDAAGRVFDLMDADPEELAGASTTPTAAPVGLELQHVIWAYPARPEAQVLRGVSCTVRPLSLCCICGASGGGKSTLLLLAAGMLEAPGVFINGVPLQSLSKSWLRSQIGYVQQSAGLFSGSIRFNLEYGLVRLSRG